MKEKVIEYNYGKKVEAQGGLYLKFVSPNMRGVPDRICLMPIPEEHRKIVNQYLQFVELKAPGKKPRPDQLRVHRKLLKLGYNVHIVDSKAGTE